MFNKSKIKKKIFCFLKKLNDFKPVFNIPNFLTTIRIILIYPFVISFLNENYIKSSKFLIFSGITDFLDGFLSRFLNQQTKFGEILDPIADKLTLVSIMICVGTKFRSVFPFMVILIVKEICMLIAGAYLFKRTQKTIKAKWYGKLGTAFFYFSLTTIVVIQALWKVKNDFLINLLMFITALLMFHALIRYSIEFVSIVRAKRSKK